MLTKRINPQYSSLENELDGLIQNFETQGDFITKPARNALKLNMLANEQVAIKSFRVPNLLNQIVYRFLRKSKAQRSYEYAIKLLKHDIGTPKPIAYYEYFNVLFFRSSFYICAYNESELTYRDLTFDFEIPEWESILREFTRFTFKLHENGINFLDHSPGNTLINRTSDGFIFNLVDLNRMKFGPMDFETRVKNFRKLSTHKEMVEIMSDEYAKCTGEDFDKIFGLMWKSTLDFQEKHIRKRQLKNRLLFWLAKK